MTRPSSSPRALWVRRTGKDSSSSKKESLLQRSPARIAQLVEHFHGKQHLARARRHDSGTKSVSVDLGGFAGESEGPVRSAYVGPTLDCSECGGPLKRHRDTWSCPRCGLLF